MQNARVNFGDQEHLLANRVTTLGRTSENDVSFPEDSNVSRYHAEIESKFGDYWLIDLQSSNGTTVNGNRITSEVLLKEGDNILLGGSSELLFTFKEKELETDEPKVEETKSEAPAADEVPSESEDSLDDKSESPESGETQKSSKLPMLFGCAGLTVGLAIVCVVGAVLFAPQCSISASACDAQAVISSPETGDTITKAVDIEIESENDDCAVTAIFTIGGDEIATVTDKPFTAKLDPARFATLSDGFEHALLVVLLDEDGNQISKTSEVALVIETQEIESAKLDDTPETGNNVEPTVSKPTTSGTNVSVIDTKLMSENLLKQFSGNTTYKFDPQFLNEVQKKTSEYTSKGYFARASTFKDVINEAFVKEQNLDPALGYILAMSRTQFQLQNNPAGEGLWRMPNEFVETNGYNLLCGDNKSLSDPGQICAAKASSLYLKGLVIGVFEGDIISSVAAFGKSQQAANIWKSSLPADRTDFWNVIKTPKEREQIVRFFAAAVVAQNPQKFGLTDDRPISELYGFIVQN